MFDGCNALFFFFQAEDGIRDIGVTGVQTCALPIWSIPKGTYPGVDKDVPTAAEMTLFVAHEIMAEPLAYEITKVLLERTPRSEERRVGKEGRSRWAPYHLKKKKKNNRGVLCK